MKALKSAFINRGFYFSVHNQHFVEKTFTTAFYNNVNWSLFFNYALLYIYHTGIFALLLRES